MLCIQKVTDKFSSKHHLSLYTKLMIVLNKGKLAKHEINKEYESPLITPFYHSIHYTKFRYTPGNEFYRRTRMGKAANIEINEQIQANNKYANAFFSKVFIHSFLMLGAVGKWQIVFSFYYSSIYKIINHTTFTKSASEKKESGNWEANGRVAIVEGKV